MDVGSVSRFMAENGIHGIQREHSNSLPSLPERKSVNLTTLEAFPPIAFSSSSEGKWGQTDFNHCLVS